MNRHQFKVAVGLIIVALTALWCLTKHPMLLASVTAISFYALLTLNDYGH
jgi:hypothetical protein